MTLPAPLEREVLEIHEIGADGRRDRIERVCSGYPAHAEEIRALVRDLERTERQVRSTVEVTARVTRIGPYRVLRVLGEGGMGTVLLAEQEEPIRRLVALKIIKLDADIMESRCFELERRLLAKMQHSSIARVFGAGTTKRGHPFLAMEYVRGEPITAYCDARRLGLEKRLRLFVRLCSGVEHVHQKGVVHKDLAPKNILVTVDGCRPTPKIIDFGIARFVDGCAAGAKTEIEHDQFIGTPEYMSPEQAGRNGLDVDTRSDVYALGVLLYELLAGALPFSSRKLRMVGLTEMRSRIRNEDPPVPSMRLRTLNGDRERVASLRRVGLNDLIERLESHLDGVVMKALAKDRTRRYRSVLDLADDVMR